MDLNVDPGQSFKRAITLEPSHHWVLGLTADDDASIVGRGQRQSSYQVECDCPDNCLRDHENE
ncbi:MAG: hypothetical protein QOF11_1214 [Chloroflexota bacterium]|jgi:hypothetical protein|nr:hypothetical protein [Chloroflexota bacterium]